MLTILVLVLCAFSGCAVVGPASINMGRASYNEAINRTEDKQMLLSIVKGCYGETFSLLAVSAVVANVRFRTNAAVQAGIGPDEDYAGNLVPFSGGLVYEENPTITYEPVYGERYIRQLMVPIPLDLLVLSIRAGRQSAQQFTMLVKKINNLRNPDFLHAPSTEPDPRFQRFVELNMELDKASVLDILADPREEVPFDILIRHYAPLYSEKVQEYLSLIGILMPGDESKDIILPVYFAVKGRDLHGVAISTRSTHDLIQILRSTVKIPEEHADAGLALNYPRPGLAGKDIHIHSSKDKPERASVAVKYRGYWFYVDDTDMRTKLFYKKVRALWSISIAASGDRRAAPVLTIPASR